MRLRFPTGLALAFCSLLLMGHAAEAQAPPVQSAAVAPNAPRRHGHVGHGILNGQLYSRAERQGEDQRLRRSSD